MNDTKEKLEEEFDMTTNEGRLDYAKKHYPVGTQYLPVATSRIVTCATLQFATSIADFFYVDNIIEGIQVGKNRGLIYNCDSNKWAEIINNK